MILSLLCLLTCCCGSTLLHARLLGFAVDRDTLDAGVVPVGSSVTMNLVISVRRDTMVGLKDSVMIMSAVLRDGTVGFSLPVPGEGLKIDTIDPTLFPIRFQPQRAGSVVDELMLIGNHADTVRVVLIGYGNESDLRLDTVDAAAGDLLTLRISGFPPLTTLPVSRTVSVRLRFDPDALVPKSFRFFPEPDGPPLTSYGLDGRLQLQWRYPVSQGDTASYADITFRGLSTAQSENLVVVEEVRWGDSILPIPAPGLVRLSGCDIGRDVPMGKRMSAAGVKVDPTGSSITLDYSATAGVEPTLGLFDLAGNQLLRMRLPAATGGNQQVTVPIDFSARGFHLLELRDGDERVVLPLMIAR